MEQAIDLGRISAIEALELDPALGTNQNLSSDVRGWDAGISAVNLRDLGTNRSLTLIDGQRRVSGSARSSAVDIGMIPVSMIDRIERSEEHTSELQSLMRISYAVLCLKNKKHQQNITQ